MSKSKSKGFRARATRAWNKLTGSPSPSAPPSRSETPALPKVVLSPPVSEPSSASLQAPATLSPMPTWPITAPSSQVLSVAALPLPAPASPTPSLRIPAPLSESQPAPSRGIAWSGLSTALQALHASAEFFPPLQSVVGGLLSGFRTLEAREATKNQEECGPLVRELKTMSETLDRHLPGMTASSMMNFIVEQIQSIQNQVDIITKIQARDSIGRLIQAEQVREALTKCDQYIKAISRQLQNDRLESIKPAKLATYDSSLSTEINRRACTEKTRTGVLSDLDAWLNVPNSPSVCWMNGMAGTGKTTIAYTFAQRLERRKQLAASFFCTRTTSECRDVARIIPTIAYQIARFSVPFLAALCDVLKKNPDILSRTVPTLFEEMIKQPLQQVKDQMPRGVVIVIDALDECTATNGAKLVLDILLREAHGLPLKIFVTSRPEPSIQSSIQEQPKSSRSIYELHTVKPSDVQADIELYLHEELPLVERSQIQQLAIMSGILFIYAATAVRYIQGGDQKERLKTMLSVGSTSAKKHADIDRLYGTILAAACDMDRLEDDEVERIKQVLWTVVCSREPTNVKMLAVLSGIEDEDSTFAALKPLQSVLHVSENREAVSTLHASFPDYLFNHSRSASFFCDAKQQDGYLAGQCFKVMKNQLRFNICGLESSYIPDERVPNFDKRVAQAISPTLAYVCRYWADHLDKAREMDELHEQLDRFLSERFLFWIEVMSLKQWIGLAARVVLTAKLWVQTRYPSSKLVRFTEDARRFAGHLAANPISSSTPHIYVSALPFCHQTSMVYANHCKSIRGVIEPRGPGIENRRETIIASWGVETSAISVAYSPDGMQIAVGCENGDVLIKDAYTGVSSSNPLCGHTELVRSVGFSPDGRMIVSGSEDKTIRTWNAEDGTAIGTLQGHTSYVASVAFSPDGTRIVSGSGDKTIRMWDAEDETAIGTPLQGHTGPVYSVSFSHDSKRIVSGSEDKTIRLWDAGGGTTIGAPLQGHTDCVSSVAFSPDGTRVVSGSFDNTIRLWDAEDGAAIGVPLQGHVRDVCSVAFSPDGTRIVSGSYDDTIWVWNAEDGTEVNVLEGHIEAVLSVAFSPDSTRIVSGSYDRTIRLWDAEDGVAISATAQDGIEPVWSVAFSPDSTRIVSGFSDQTIQMWNAEDGTAIGAPLEGHTMTILSVVFSPDGTRIVSGSWDKTIRVWNAEDGTAIGVPIEGHTDPVYSVAFSPDGTRIVSGSVDMTIRMWNAENGAAVGTPLEGHTDCVSSVVFSPDGTRIVSGSYDNTIRLWNAEDGTAIGAPLEGHTHYVRSVAFSPDGARIVSGSFDNTIRMWNAEDGTAIGAPLQGHTDFIMSTEFSPDGTRIVSGSWDKTIRMWNAEDGSAIGTPLLGYTDRVMSVAFSPDGTRIVAGSSGSIVQVLNVEDETMISVLSQGHDAAVQSATNLLAETHVVSTLSQTTPNSKACGAIPLIDSWSVTNDGWVVDSASRLIFWVPQDLANFVPSPRRLWGVRPNGAIYIDRGNALLGEHWTKCYLTRRSL